MVMHTESALSCKLNLENIYLFSNIKFQTYYFSFVFLRIVSKNMPVQMFVIFKDVSKLQAVC